jgi:trimeric autotransporter adhesin
VISALEVFQGSLIAAGYFSSVNGGVPAHSIARWDGSSWSTVGAGFGTGLCGDYQYVFSLCSTDEGLYAGGNFYSSDGIQIGNAAHWSGEAWESMESGTDGSGIYALAPALTGLFAGGDFRHAGDEESYYVGRWWESTTDAPPAAPHGTTDLLIPNPYRAGDTILLRIPSDAASEVCLYSVTGARVRTLYTGGLRNTWTALAWDGRTDAGTQAGAGVYYLTVRSMVGRMARRLVLLP